MDEPFGVHAKEKSQSSTGLLVGLLEMLSFADLRTPGVHQESDCPKTG
jgi:hypothetical protein